MKQTLFTFLLITALGMASCRKDRIQLTIKQYDNQQILNYIAAHGLTGMKRDTIGGDTTGMYYQILNPGTQSINGVPVTPLDYPSMVSFVYTESSFDGTYTQPDTIANHYYDFVGHIFSNHMPLGLHTAVHNLLKYPDASMRVLIPSHLAYGINGTGSGSNLVANNKILGNQCLDYYVHAVNNFSPYDDMVIQNYMKAISLTGYTKVQSKLLPGNYYYYKILIPATSKDPITVNSTATVTFTGQIYDGTIFGQYNVAGGKPVPIATAVPGVQEGLEYYAVAGTEISLLMPSTLGYGLTPPSSAGVPPFSCLRFTFDVLAVTP